MASTVATLDVPGAGPIVNVLAQILSLCNTMKDDQGIFVRLHQRLQDIYDALREMEQEQRLPPSGCLGEYTQLLHRYLKGLMRNQGDGRAKRPLKHHKMTDELVALDKGVDVVRNHLALPPTTGAMIESMQQLEKDTTHVRAKLAKVDGNGSVVATWSRVAATDSPSNQLSPHDHNTQQDSPASTRLLVSMLRNGSDDQKTNTATALRSLVLDDVNRVAFAEAGGIAPLVALVADGNDDQKGNAAGALRLLAANSAIRIAISEAGGIAPLVVLVANGNGDQKELAAAALWLLSLSALNRVAVVEAGGIAPLVALVVSGSDDQKEYAAAALSNLAEDARNQVAILEASGIKPLVELVSRGNDSQKEHAADALRSLAENAANQVAIAEAGGIGPLVALVANGDDDQIAKAIEALSNLAESASN